MSSTFYTEEKKDSFVAVSVDPEVPEYDGNSTIDSITALIAEGEDLYTLSISFFW